MQLSSLHRACYELNREATVNWMASLVPEADTSDAEMDSESPISEPDAENQAQATPANNGQGTVWARPRHWLALEGGTQGNSSMFGGTF